MQDGKENIIVDLTFQFAVEILEYAELLDVNKKFVVSRQLARAGLSVGANVRESQNAESKDDFIHKMKIAAKEADEVEFILSVCNSIKSYPKKPELLEKIRVIIKIISKIIGTSKRGR